MIDIIMHRVILNIFMLSTDHIREMTSKKVNTQEHQRCIHVRTSTSQGGKNKIQRNNTVIHDNATRDSGLIYSSLFFNMQVVACPLGSLLFRPSNRTLPPHWVRLRPTYRVLQMATLYNKARL